MIRLEPFTMGDAAELIDWIPSGEFLMQWGGPGFIYPLTFEQIEGYVHAADQRVFKAVEENGGITAGHICLSSIDLKNDSCRISKVMVNPALRGKGYGSALLSEVLKFAFVELNVHRVSLGVFDFNEEAVACYKKAGFKQEGHLRDCRKMNDSYWSIFEMGILRNEWEEVRAVSSHQIVTG